METHRDFFPHILFPDDLAVMSLAHRDAMAKTGCTDLDPEEVARIALHFYQMGLVDETKLAQVTAEVARRANPLAQNLHVEVREPTSKEMSCQAPKQVTPSERR
ncbi:hypothetical protein [Neorhizobium alkalisoli]|uniref:hypothetical protein n=1 Tax=Neorhizobium alkalisoli TaxID=528178 RepID=UPI000CF9C17C|nr:hypothetical protein [Neorhizobium alkalisoli]